jgi:Tol biopolymer transport system component
MRTSADDVSTVSTLTRGVERKLTEPGQFNGVALSPDGRLLLGMPGSDAPPPVRGATFGLEDHALTALHASDPTLNLVPSVWTPDGRRIVYFGWDDQKPARTGIYLADYPTGNHLKLLLPRPGRIADEPISISPDGKQLLFYRATAPDPDPHLNGSLWVVRVTGDTPHKISGDVHPYDAASWSPDGAQIVFATTRLEPRGAIWKVAPDGSGLRKLFTDAAGRFPLTPTWSPDGTQILFALDATNDDWTHQPNELYVINSDGGHLRPVKIAAGFKRFFTWVQ